VLKIWHTPNILSTQLTSKPIPHSSPCDAVNSCHPAKEGITCKTCRCYVVPQKLPAPGGEESLVAPFCIVTKGSNQSFGVWPHPKRQSPMDPSGYPLRTKADHANFCLARAGEQGIAVSKLRVILRPFQYSTNHSLTRAWRLVSSWSVIV
jgi:hypothetical protein